VNEYERNILLANRPIVLDNGAFEKGTPDGIDDLLRKCHRLQPKYVFAPDNLFNATKTRAGYEAFKYIMTKTGKSYKIGVVVQADNEEEYLEEFKKYNKDPDVAVIGLSYLAISHSIKYKTKAKIPKGVIAKKKDSWSVFGDVDYTADRIEMLKKINNLKLDKIKPCHLLGLGKSYEDIIYAKENCPFCFCNDTSTCYVAASHGLTLTDSLSTPSGKIKDKIKIDDQSSALIRGIFCLNINKVESVIYKSTQQSLI
jgi:hypothetical protein